MGLAGLGSSLHAVTDNSKINAPFWFQWLDVPLCGNHSYTITIAEMSDISRIPGCDTDRQDWYPISFSFRTYSFPSSDWSEYKYALQEYLLAPNPVVRDVGYTTIPSQQLTFNSLGHQSVILQFECDYCQDMVEFRGDAIVPFNPVYHIVVHRLFVPTLTRSTCLLYNIGWFCRSLVLCVVVTAIRRLKATDHVACIWLDWLSISGYTARGNCTRSVTYDSFT